MNIKDSHGHFNICDAHFMIIKLQVPVHTQKFAYSSKFKNTEWILMKTEKNKKPI